jgi:predicted GTPase
MVTKEPITQHDAAVQTDPPPPPYDEADSIESIKRLKRFLLHGLRREYNAEGDPLNLTFKESSQ